MEGTKTVIEEISEGVAQFNAFFKGAKDGKPFQYLDTELIFCVGETQLPLRVPVRAVANASENAFSFHTAHNTDKGLAKRALSCGACGEALNEANTLKAFEYSKGEFLYFTKSEVEKAKRVKGIRVVGVTRLGGFAFTDLLPLLTSVNKVFRVVPSAPKKSDKKEAQAKKTQGVKDFYALYNALYYSNNLLVCKVVVGNDDKLALLIPTENNAAFVLATLFWATEKYCEPLFAVEPQGDGERDIMKEGALKQLFELLPEPSELGEASERAEYLNALIQERLEGKPLEETPSATVETQADNVLASLLVLKELKEKKNASASASEKKSEGEGEAVAVAGESG